MKKLSLEEFKASLSLPKPPAGLSAHQQALWFAGRGEWERAHQIVQDMNDPLASRIHAFLHRQEGDLSNASYWYARAGVTQPATTISEEWEALARD